MLSGHRLHPEHVVVQLQRVRHRGARDGDRRTRDVLADDLVQLQGVESERTEIVDAE